MREDRFFGNFDISKGKIIKITEQGIFHQVKNVLKKKINDEIILCDGNLKEGLARIKSFQKDGIEAEILKIRENQNEPSNYVSLYCSILKKNSFELVVQKATEIGVKEVIPLICRNTVKLGLNLERLKKIIKEAAEQSKRGILPKIENPVIFEKAVKKVNKESFKILFDISGKSLADLKSKNFKKFSIFIGPEGGWDKREIDLAQKENFTILNLGSLNLKAETANIIASFLIVNFDSIFK